MAFSKVAAGGLVAAGGDRQQPHMAQPIGRGAALGKAWSMFQPLPIGRPGRLSRALANSSNSAR